MWGRHTGRDGCKCGGRHTGRDSCRCGVGIQVETVVNVGVGIQYNCLLIKHEAGIAYSHTGTYIL